MTRSSSPAAVAAIQVHSCYHRLARVHTGNLSMACKGVQWLALAMLLSVGVALAQYEEAIEGGGACQACKLPQAAAFRDLVV